MEAIDPGHVYALRTLDDVSTNYRQSLVFVKREGPKYPGNVGQRPGTTLQEVLRACIDRVQYLDKQVPDAVNEHVISKLRAAIWLLEIRAARRHGRHIPKTSFAIEQEPVCSKCLHIGCKGDCHA